MSNRWKFSLYILLALIAGVLYAGDFTHITYPCQPPPDAAGCVSIEKVMMHPIDLASNVQGSLTHFLRTFLVVFLIVLVLFVVSNSSWVLANKRQRQPTKQP